MARMHTIGYLPPSSNSNLNQSQRRSIAHLRKQRLDTVSRKVTYTGPKAINHFSFVRESANDNKTIRFVLKDKINKVSIKILIMLIAFWPIELTIGEFDTSIFDWELYKKFLRHIKGENRAPFLIYKYQLRQSKPNLGYRKTTINLPFNKSLWQWNCCFSIPLQYLDSNRK